MKKILVVVDMQVDFIDGSLGTEEAVSILPNVSEKISNFDGEIIFTRDTHYENYLECQEGIKLPVEHCIFGTDGWQIHPELRLSGGEKIVDKNTFGSIKLPEFISNLNRNNEDLEITLVGLCTDICVISNAIILKGNFPEARIIVDASCCAGVTRETHTNALNAMKMCHIEIVEEN